MNKFEYFHVLQGDYGYGHGWEDLSAGTRREMRDDLRARIAEEEEPWSGSYRIVHRRVRSRLVAEVTP